MKKIKQFLFKSVFKVKDFNVRVWMLILVGSLIANGVKQIALSKSIADFPDLTGQYYLQETERIMGKMMFMQSTIKLEKNGEEYAYKLIQVTGGESSSTEKNVYSGTMSSSLKMVENKYTGVGYKWYFDGDDELRDRGAHIHFSKILVDDNNFSMLDLEWKKGRGKGMVHEKVNSQGIDE